MELISNREVYEALERARVALNEGVSHLQRQAKDREALVMAADLSQVSEGIKRVNGTLGHVSPGIRFYVSTEEDDQEPEKEKAKRQPRKSKEPRVKTSTGATA